MASCAPVSGPKPEPLSFSSVTVKVCGWPIGLTASGVILIRAATQTFVAGPELLPAPFVVRTSVTPPTEVVTLALTTVDPAVGEVIVAAQEPVVPMVVQESGVVKEPGPLTLAKVITVPAGAFAKPF